MDAPDAIPREPFVGLRPFERREAMLFFGRRRQTLELLERLHDHRFVAVVGRSGCGKSSLVRAGLLPKLEAGLLVEERDRWLDAIMTPGDRPRLALARAVAAATGGGDADALAEEIALRGLPPILDRLRPALARADSNLLILVDQFEEIFRYGAADDDVWRTEATDFVSLIVALAEQRELPVYVVLTMRSDFLSTCDAFPGLPEAMNRGLYLVPRLERGEHRQAIEGPIRLFGRGASHRLIDRLLNDLEGKPDQLPVLQHALMRMWRHADGDRPLDLEDYEAVGRIDQALARHAEEALEGMDEQMLRTTELVFRTLTTTDERNRRVRRPAPLSELVATTGEKPETVREIVDRFRGGGRSFLRLAGRDDDPDPRVDISHESLIRRWGRLRRWVDREARDGRLYRRLVDTARRWEKGKESLWRDPALSRALDWWAKTRASETAQQGPSRVWTERYGGHRELVWRFLTASADQREAEHRDRRAQEDLRRRKAKLASYVAYLSIVALVAVGFGWYALVKSREAVKQSREAQRQREAAEEARQQAVDAFEEQERLQRAALTSYSPDGKVLVSVTDAGRVLLWDAETESVIDTLETEGRLQSIAFSDDGTRVAACGDPDVWIWNTGTAELVSTLRGHEGTVLNADFSPSGELIATAGADLTARLWRVETGEEIRKFDKFSKAVIDVSFSDDGREIICLSADGISQTWASPSGSFQEEKFASRVAIVEDEDEDEVIAEAQNLLKALALYRGPVDGSRGIHTQAAVEAFQKANRLPVDGTISPELVQKLKTAKMRTRKPAIVRFEATPERVTRGAAARLSWETLNAEEVRLSGPDHDDVPVATNEKGRLVRPRETAIYVLTARRSEEETKRRVQIEVTAPRPELRDRLELAELYTRAPPLSVRELFERVKRATVTVGERNEHGIGTRTGFMLNRAGHVLTIQTRFDSRDSETPVWFEGGKTRLTYRLVDEVPTDLTPDDAGSNIGPTWFVILAPAEGAALPFSDDEPYWLPVAGAGTRAGRAFAPSGALRIYSPMTGQAQKDRLIAKTAQFTSTIDSLETPREVSDLADLRYRCSYCGTGWMGAPVFDSSGNVWAVEWGANQDLHIGVWVYPVIEHLQGPTRRLRAQR